MRPLAELAALMARPVPPLDRTLAVLGAVVRSDQDPDAALRLLDLQAAACTADDPDGLCAELFGPGGLAPARADYYDPANSVLGEVLSRRRGIPISLAAVAIEVGRRRGVGLLGVGMPGHFLLRSADDPDRFFDPYDGGRSADRAACRARFEQVNGPEAHFDPTHLEPVSSRAIVGRVLNNLQVAAGRSGDRQTAAAVGRVRVLLSRTTLN